MAKRDLNRRSSLVQEKHDSSGSEKGEGEGEFNFENAVKRASLLRVFGVTAAPKPTSGRRIYYDPEQSSVDLNVSKQLDIISEKKKVRCAQI